MKKIICFVFALIMTLSLTACQNKPAKPDVSPDIKVTMTAQEVLDTLKEKLGDSYGCDTAEMEEKMSGFFGLDMDQVESWAAESNSNSSISMDFAVVLKVKEGYAKDAAACLQSAFEQTLSYSQMYNMDLYKVNQGRIFISGDYVAYFILGEPGDWEASEEVQAQFAIKEAEKVDKAWEEIFGAKPENIAATAK